MIIREMVLDVKLDSISFIPRKFTQGDINTHILHINLDKSLDVRTKRMVITYILPYGYTPIVETYEPKPSNTIIVPNECLKKIGRVFIEIAFHDILTRDLITVSNKAYFDVIKTINGSRDEAIAGEMLEKTLIEQIDEVNNMFKAKQEELEILIENKIMEEAETKIDEAIESNLEGIITDINNVAKQAIEEAKKEIDNYLIPAKDKVVSLAKTDIDKYIEDNKAMLKGDKGDIGATGAKGEKGEKGDTGANGKSIEFEWRGTELGIRLQGETEFKYVDLKGEKGDKGDKGDSATPQA